jgi:hypothetical protein
MVHELIEARDERRLLRLQRQLAAYKLLIIDELGYVPLSTTGAELLFEVFSQRYERGSIIVTSNLPFDEWTGVFGSERLTGALPRAARQEGESCRRRRQKCVTRIIARQHACDLQPIGEPSLQILQRMDSEVDIVGEKSLFDLFCEEPLTANFGEKPVLHAIAAGSYRHNLGFGYCERWVFGDQASPHKRRLMQRHRAAPGSDSEGTR